MTTRPDSPSEISAPSSTTGSAVVPKTRVPAADDLPLAAAARNAAAAMTATAITTFKALPLTFTPFKSDPPSANLGAEYPLRHQKCEAAGQKPPFFRRAYPPFS